MNLHSEASLFKSDNQLNQRNYPVSLVDNNKVALPLHIQNLEKALNLNSFLKQVHSFIDDNRDDKISVTLNKQQSKDVKASMYSFNHNKTAKGKNNNWLKNILIDNSDESDNEDIEHSVQQLLKIRKYKNKKQSADNWPPGKQEGKIGSSLSSNILSLSDSVPLSSLFKSEKSCKSQIKKQKTSKKKLKSGEPIKQQQNDKPNDIKIPDDRPSYALNTYFEPTLNSKENDSYSLKKDYPDELHQLDSTSCLETGKLLDDIKYETLTDEIMLQGDSNDFVNSFLTNSRNDEIIYSNQLPDDIFETEEEETSNGFYDNDYDVLSHKLALNSRPPPPPVELLIDQPTKAAFGEPKVNGVIEGLSSNLGEHLNENMNHNLNAINRHLTSNSNGNSNSNLNLNQVKNELDRTENDADQESESVERPVEGNQISDQLDSQRLTKINLINSATPINSINLANLVDSTQATSTSIASASLPVSLISSLHTTPSMSLSGSTNPTNSTALSLPNPAILSANPGKLIEPAEANGTLNKTIAKKKVAGKALLAELEPEQIQNKRRKLWSSIAKKDIPKAYKSRLIARKDVLNNCRRLAQCCQKDRDRVIGIPKLNRERSKKSNKEIATYWKRSAQSAVTNCEPPAAIAVTPVQLTS